MWEYKIWFIPASPDVRPMEYELKCIDDFGWEVVSMAPSLTPHALLDQPVYIVVSRRPKEK